MPLIPNILDGFNVTCFAYGMTGAGKTFTMLGDMNYEEGNSFKIDNQGLCFQSIEGIYNGMLERQLEVQYDLKVSYLEIYNEQVRDLLQEKQQSLMIVEDPQKGVVVPDLTEYRINKSEELYSLILMGNQRRTLAPTAANQFSSRSHAILIFSIEGRSRAKNVKDGIFYSKLQIIDLAGSERAAATENRGQRMVEGANINKSLLALGNCINILSDKNKAGSYVPYRDSKLTRLLKDSLGGNTKTIMISCISPAFSAFEETVNTLKYASRARNIKKKTVRNVKEVETHVSRYKDIIESLNHEIEFLRNQLRDRQSSVGGNPSSISPIRSPISVPINKNMKSLENTSNQKNIIQRPNLTKITYVQNTHGNVTPIRLSTNVKHNQVSQRNLNYNNCSDSLLEVSSMTMDQNKNFVEIEEEIFKTQNEKLKLQQELLLSGQKTQQTTTTEQQKSQNATIEDTEEQVYIERLSQNLLSNFEEHWELKHSIAELEDLQNKNKDQLQLLRQEIHDLEKQLQAKSNNTQLECQIVKVITFKQNEMKIIEKNHVNNINILNEMQTALGVNQEQKQKLQKMLLKMHSNKKQTILTTQIEMRKLKLEKTDLQLQNLQMKKFTQQHLIEKENNDNRMNEMQRKIEEMQRQLEQKDSLLKQKQFELQKKDQELLNIKGTGSMVQHQEQMSFSASNTQHIDIKRTLRDQINLMYVNEYQPNSARMTNDQQAEMNKQLDINKKLLLSGFFEDDYNGELPQDQNTQPKEEAPTSLNIINTVLKTKRQSNDATSSAFASSMKPSKGYTPNNRYSKQKTVKNEDKNKLDISNITMNMDTNQSDIMMIDEMFQNDNKNLHQGNASKRMTADYLSKNQKTPITQVDLYHPEQITAEKVVSLYQPISQTSNQRYQNQKPDTSIQNKAYDSRREQQQSNNKKSAQKRSQKLNRYLSFHRKDEKQTENKESITVQAQQRNGSQQYQECEKENNSRNTNSQQDQQFQTLSNENRSQKAISPLNEEFGSQTLDGRAQGQNNFVSNKFEQRKYSQPFTSQQRQHATPQSNNHQNQSSRRPPSPSINNISQTSSSSVFQSYAQIRRQSKERQQSYQKKQQTSSVAHAINTITNSNPPQNDRYSSKNVVHKIDLTNLNSNNTQAVQNKYKASATATISKYGPIKATASQMTIMNPTGSNFNMQTSGENPQSIGQTYFENFIKKKNSLGNFNSQPNSLSNSQRNGAVKVLNNGSPQITNQATMSAHMIKQNEHQNSNQPILSTNQPVFLKKNSKSNSINVQSLDELQINSHTSTIQVSQGKLNKELDTLLAKQKEQLNKDKEKLQKNHTVFTTSFASTLAGMNQQPQTERLQYDSARTANGGGLSARQMTGQQQKNRYQESLNDDDIVDERGLLESPQQRKFVSSNSSQVGLPFN